jgi:hypothetical protein
VRIAVWADLVGDTEIVSPPENVTRLITRERENDGTSESVAIGGEVVDVSVLETSVTLRRDVTVSDKEAVLRIIESVAENEKLRDNVAEILVSETSLV